jgi:predicted dithiol-disulfide oxidoreductase (DUF899 family)
MGQPDLARRAHCFAAKMPRLPRRLRRAGHWPESFHSRRLQLEDRAARLGGRAGRLVGCDPHNPADFRSAQSGPRRQTGTEDESGERTTSSLSRQLSPLRHILKPNQTMNYPKVVSRTDWLIARKALLAEEKELTHRRDRINAARRRLPMVALSKDYFFEGPEGKAGLLDLFSHHVQLIVYHFMFEPDPPAGKSGEPYEEGCSGCSFVVDSIGHLSHLHARNTSLVLVSRAPWRKIAPFKSRMGWNIPWFSSFESAFNYDFHATVDEAVALIEYNYQDKTTLQKKGETYHLAGEQPGVSVFLRDEEDRIFHTYSTYGRGLDLLDGTYNWLDLTPFGRQESWEDSPQGWPQTPTHEWLRHHDRYQESASSGDACCDASNRSPTEGLLAFR